MNKKEDKRREKILEVSKELFAVYGLKGVSNKDISSAAGVNSALIHYYFKSKEGIYKYILDSYAQRATEGAQGILREPEGVADFKLMLEIYTKRIMEIMTKDINAFRVVVRESDIMSPEYKYVFDESLNKFNDQLQEFLEKAQSKKIFPNEVNCNDIITFYWAILMNQIRLDVHYKDYIGKSICDREYRDEFVMKVLNFFYASMSLK